MDIEAYRMRPESKLRWVLVLTHKNSDLPDNIFLSRKLFTNNVEEAIAFRYKWVAELFLHAFVNLHIPDTKYFKPVRYMFY